MYKGSLVLGVVAAVVVLGRVDAFFSCTSTFIRFAFVYTVRVCVM